MNPISCSNLSTNSYKRSEPKRSEYIILGGKPWPIVRVADDDERSGVIAEKLIAGFQQLCVLAVIKDEIRQEDNIKGALGIDRGFVIAP